jgi:hypothetical protein
MHKQTQTSTPPDTGRSLDTWRRVARALSLRIANLELEDDEALAEYGYLFERSVEIQDEVIERQLGLRRLRERLLALESILRRAA